MRQQYHGGVCGELFVLEVRVQVADMGEREGVRRQQGLLRLMCPMLLLLRLTMRLLLLRVV